MKNADPVGRAAIKAPFRGRTPKAFSILFAFAFVLAPALLAAPAYPGEGLFPRPGPRANSCPVILVHGILGFGQDEQLPLSAWGGLADYPKQFSEEGWRVYSATVGPLSSNWDRACELYAYIKGGRTDFGAAHSARYGHSRWGREYPGVYPEWGDRNKVLLFCHSMGGQTGRLLVQLLEAGEAEEAAASPGDPSPLFTGGHSWVLGLLSLSSPHDGSTLSLVLDYRRQVVRRVTAALLAGASPVYDAMLEHWGLGRAEGESSASLAARLEANDAWSLGEDGCYHDLTPEGAAELNRWVRAWPEVYYFSWAASATRDFDRRQVPGASMNPLISLNALAMGAYLGTDAPWTIGTPWQENDGVVNTISMDGPKLDSKDTILPFSGKPAPGVWNYMGRLSETDHLDLLGFPTPPWYAPPGFASTEDWYRFNLALLSSLEPGP